MCFPLLLKGANHVDISGEPAWLESMQLKYAETAKLNGVWVIGACGIYHNHIVVPIVIVCHFHN